MNMNAMSPEEYRNFGEAMGTRVCEHFDGFVIVGFHATTGEPVIFVNDAGSVKNRCALSSLLQTALMATSVSVNPPGR